VPERFEADDIKFVVTAAMEIPVMQPNVAVTSNRTVHQRYRQLLRTGFSPDESAALIALADGIGRHGEGDSPAASAWRWQEISLIEFMGYLARSGRLGGPDDGGP
jgi:cytochrome P450